MATKLFKGRTGALVAPVADVLNEAGGRAYALSDRELLAKYACTGCLSDTFYASAEAQLGDVVGAASRCDPEFIASCAVYSRRKGYLKDMPALLLAVLDNRKETSSVLFEETFATVVDNARLLRNFCRTVRSGLLGRRSFSRRARRAIKSWFLSRSGDQLFRDSVGKDPSLADVIKMIRPKPESEKKDYLYRWLINKPSAVDSCPELLRSYLRWLRDGGEIPDVPLQMITSELSDTKSWTKIALNSKWHRARMNLNAFAKHGVFADREIVAQIAKKLRNPEDIRKAKAFPYQSLMAYMAVRFNEKVPDEIKDALQDAIEISIENVPEIQGRIAVCVDNSGSMNAPVTGRSSRTTKVTCRMCAGLVAATFFRRNPQTDVYAFTTDSALLRLNPRDSLPTLSAQISNHMDGGTACSAPLAHMNRDKRDYDLVVFLSDNQSWCDSGSALWPSYQIPTTMVEWVKFLKRNPKSRMVRVDLAPYSTTQVPESRKEILNVGGFSDNVWEVVDAFLKGSMDDGKYWSRKVEEFKS